MEKNIIPQLKKRNKPNTNMENTNIIKYSITNLYDNLVINNSEKIEVTIDNLKNDIYEEEFFNLNEITGDVNCFFRILSYYLYNNENSHKNLRDSAYQYVSNNITKFYENCYVEDDMYYIDIKEGNLVKKYVLDEYVEKIKENKFFSGFIEINAMSIKNLLYLSKFIKNRRYNLYKFSK